MLYLIAGGAVVARVTRDDQVLAQRGRGSGRRPDQFGHPARLLQRTLPAFCTEHRLVIAQTRVAVAAESFDETDAGALQRAVALGGLNH